MTTYLPGQLASVPLSVSNPNAGYTGLSSAGPNTGTPTLTNPGSSTSSTSLTGSNPTPTLSSPTTQPNPATPVTGSTALTGDALDSYLENSFNTSPDSVGIMNAYNNQTNAINANLGNSNAATENYYAGQSAESQVQGAANFQTGITNSKGLINPSAMQIIQDQSESLLSSINDQMNTAIASNNSAAAESLANAAATEMTNLVTARQNFLANYFSAQNESRSEASFPLTQAQTQSETQSNLASAAASTAGAALAQAQASQVSALTPAQIEEALASAGASAAGANASNASAEQTNALTSFLKVGTVNSSDPNVQSLINGSATPAEIQDKYPTSIYGGYAASIISAAQSSGYNLNQGTLTAQSQSNTTDALSSGNPFSILGALGTEAVNSVGSLLSGGSGNSSTPSVTSVTMKGPGGTYSVPSSQVSTFENNGYTTVQ